jgi:hypothetical protein
MAIRFYEGDSLLPHGLALGMFCYSVVVAYIETVKKYIFRFFMKPKLTKGHWQGHSSYVPKWWWGASNSFFWHYVGCVVIRSSPLSRLFPHSVWPCFAVFCRVWKISCGNKVYANISRQAGSKQIYIFEAPVKTCVVLLTNQR